MAGKPSGLNRNERFQLRLDGATLDALKRRAAREEVPINHLVVSILERELDDTSRYHQQMAAKQSFISAAWLNVIAARLLPVDVRKEVLRSIQDQASRAFGANPEIPRGLLESKSADDSEFVTELFELFERHAENRWNIRPE
ncbi:hypothetical protein ABI_00450 [Asticcacaulis biprosthecium C19]|jgi:hypothetical protein|uniref:Uncharacterized protein n=1 Tax=Asticcacaulis biprosthecium C19 TaxID=715226 RepID=F4QG02_9CAUL|nr:hypothetical protein [Asticcacaulis biprosthecium]EGF93813.1 hypothetical protein ABI_00450 [Asticcacaulis biprosthecium C19]